MPVSLTMEQQFLGNNVWRRAVKMLRALKQFGMELATPCSQLQTRKQWVIIHCGHLPIALEMLT